MVGLGSSGRGSKEPICGITPETTMCSTEEQKELSKERESGRH
jgi:hypothetical protein